MPADHKAGAGPTTTGPGFNDNFYPHYLAAKRSIDDRALNRTVWDALVRALPQATAGRPAQIIEIGAGIGTMLARVVDWGLLTGPATYLLTDSNPQHLQGARHYLDQWAGRNGYKLVWLGPEHGRLHAPGTDLCLTLTAASAGELAAGHATGNRFHLLIAHAVLDLIDFPTLLPRLLPCLVRDGLAYLTCNFDGETILLPETGDGTETEILRRYHASMEARLVGARYTGRRLLSFLQRPGFELVAAGSSDWVVHPRNGRHTPDESCFLAAIIETIRRELARPEGPPPPGLEAWARLRQAQAADGTLSLLARHLDLLARSRPLPP